MAKAVFSARPAVRAFDANTVTPDASRDNVRRLVLEAVDVVELRDIDSATLSMAIVELKRQEHLIVNLL